MLQLLCTVGLLVLTSCIPPGRDMDSLGVPVFLPSCPELDLDSAPGSVAQEGCLLALELPLPVPSAPKPPAGPSLHTQADPLDSSTTHPRHRGLSWQPSLPCHIPGAGKAWCQSQLVIGTPDRCKPRCGAHVAPQGHCCPSTVPCLISLSTELVHGVHIKTWGLPDSEPRDTHLPMQLG